MSCVFVPKILQLKQEDLTEYAAVLLALCHLVIPQSLRVVNQSIGVVRRGHAHCHAPSTGVQRLHPSHTPAPRTQQVTWSIQKSKINLKHP